MALRTAAALALGALTLAACDADPSGPDAAVVAAPATAMSAATDYADTAPTFDAVLNGVSLRHPGFKGVIGSDDGARVLVLIDPLAVADLPALLADLAATLGTSPAALVASPLPALAVGRPDFHELYAVKTALRRFLFETDLVHTLDLDETTGRVEVGTSTAADADRVRAQMSPAERAVADFVRAEPAQNAVETLSPAQARALAATPSLARDLRSLRTGKFVPMIGGIAVYYQDRSGGFDRCTQGPAVRYNGAAWGFLTNAHCTGDLARNDGITFYQPFIRTADLAGVEAAEPSYRSGWFITDGYYADVAFVRSTNERTLRGQMTSADGCSSQTADCVENGIITSVPGTVSYQPKNVRVFKTGLKTGTTAGMILATCVDSDNNQTGYRILCSNLVGYAPNGQTSGNLSETGDSGAPVLVNQGAPGSNVGSLSGILWGIPGSNTTQYYYSPWENISRDGRAGDYGLPVRALTASEGAVANPRGSSGTTLPPSSPGYECPPNAIDC